MEKSSYQKWELAVEVQRKPSQWAGAYVIDVDKDEYQVVVNHSTRFIVEKYEAKDVRLPPEHSSQRFKNEQEIEVMETSLNRITHWCPGIYRIVRRRHFVQMLNGTEKDPASHVIRVRNPNPAIPDYIFQKYEIFVPAEVRPYIQRQNILLNHRFLARVGGSFLHYEKKKKLVRIISRLQDPSEAGAMQQAVELLESDYLNFVQQAGIINQMNNSKRTELDLASSAACTHRFHLRRDLFNLAIGKGGCNINGARAIPGIIYIEASNFQSTITVSGKEEAVREAVQALEYKEEGIRVPTRFLPRLIGRNGYNIKSIMHRSGTIRYVLEDDNDDYYSDQTWIKFIGIAPQIKDAITLVQYAVEDISGIMMAENDYWELVRKLETDAAGSSDMVAALDIKDSLNTTDPTNTTDPVKPARKRGRPRKSAGEPTAKKAKKSKK